MSIFNIFKKKKKEEVEIISKRDFYEWLSKKDNELSAINNEIFSNVKNKIILLTSEIKSRIEMFDSIDLDSKAPNHRIKSMMKENLKNYKNYISKMLDDLNQINSLENMVEKVASAIKKFEEKSDMASKKLSVLLSVEIKPIKSSIRLFLKELEETLKENSRVIQYFNSLEDVKINLEKMDILKKEIEIENMEIEKNKEEIENLQEKLQNKLLEIEEIKKSKEYIEAEKKKKEFNEKREEFQKELEKLFIEIDFKSLIAFHHNVKKDMEIAKKYKENFKDSVNILGMGKIIILLKDAKLFSEKIEERIEKIKAQEIEISNFSIKTISLISHENEVESIKAKIKEKENDYNIKKEKWINMLEEMKKIENSIREILKKINVVMED